MTKIKSIERNGYVISLFSFRDELTFKDEYQVTMETKERVVNSDFYSSMTEASKVFDLFADKSLVSKYN